MTINETAWNESLEFGAQNKIKFYFILFMSLKAVVNFILNPFFLLHIGSKPWPPSLCDGN